MKVRIIDFKKERKLTEDIRDASRAISPLRKELDELYDCMC